METVQLQCGNCGKVMGINAAHLGRQVQCPHCRSVVQTSPISPLSPLPAAPNYAHSPLDLDLEQDPDSIFSPPVSEDVIGGPVFTPPSSKKKMEPVAPPPAKTPPSPPAPEPAADFSTFKRRPIYDKSLLPLLVMIFLVPYAIMTTLFIGYLLMFTNRAHPLDMLPDPVPAQKKGAPQPASRQIAHDHPLAEHQKTPLGAPIQVGDLIVTPEKVALTAAPGEGDLQLFLRVKNVSKGTKFEPINDLYVLYSPSKESEGRSGKPYTFLESKTKAVASVYGAYLDYRDAQGKERTNHLIGPNEEEIVILTTTDVYRKHVASIAKSNDGYIWRVQVRRGLVDHRGKEVSATAVIGIDFTAAQIQQPAKKT